jgi:hypothetical protein
LLIHKYDWLKYIVHAKQNDWLQSVASTKTVTGYNLLFIYQKNGWLESVVYAKKYVVHTKTITGYNLLFIQNSD